MLEQSRGWGRTVRILGAIIVASVLSTETHAQGTVTATVMVGKESTLVESTDKKIEIKAAPKRGVARVLSPEGEPKAFKLLYKPNDTLEKTTDEVAYAIEGEPTHTLKLDITPPAPGLTPQAYEASFKAIFLLFILAVVLESALAVLFNWRPFVETFNARAVRPLVAFIVAYLFVYQFDLDIVTSLVNASTTMQYAANIPGKLLTALVIAGGSSGVNTMLVALGFRQVRAPESVVPKPPKNKAWLAVRVRRQEAVGDVMVFIGPPANTPIVGTIKGSSKPGLRYFLSDPGRFPGYGGHEVPPKIDTFIILRAEKRSGENVEKTWGPHALAEGAIIDLDMNI